MDNQPFFADVDLPFHVWVREGRRWVLRNATARLQGEGGAGASHSESERGARDANARR